MFLVIGATNNRELNNKIYRDAEHLGTLCNIADQPNACNFILPSVVSRGDLLIAISTSGKSPALAKRLRQDLEKQFGEEYATFLKLMGAVRNKLLSQDHNPEAHRAVFEQLIDKGLLNGLKDQNKEVVDSLLHEILGEGYDYRSLMETKNN
jgi:precorrin-2 dehydrogenase/sirohydrochlorin ferrochelatase